MFTGLIQAVGQIISIEQHDDLLKVQIEASGLPERASEVGASIAINGVCLTVTTSAAQGSAVKYCFDVGYETLELTTWKHFNEGDHVNMESALTLETPLGGHLVSGHVDAVGKLIKQQAKGDNYALEIEFPEDLAAYIAKKGSVCINGISLTVNEVTLSTLSVLIIPHTWEATTLKYLSVGESLNIEVDLMARQIVRALEVLQPKK